MIAGGYGGIDGKKHTRKQLAYEDKRSSGGRAGHAMSSEPLHWVLLTTEAVSSMEDAMRVMRYDELRWRGAITFSAGRRSGADGLACKNASKGTNSARWRSLSCDQETAAKPGGPYLITELKSRVEQDHRALRRIYFYSSD